jgi:ParB family chromosome partitioning protein
VESLEPNPYQPRSPLDPEALTALAASIRESGIVQPILVRRVGPRFQIIAGERRWRAAQRLGLATVPVTVRDVPDDRLLELALVENIQRQELTPLEEAHAFQRLQQEFHLTQEDVAAKVGRDRSTVANTLRPAPPGARDPGPDRGGEAGRGPRPRPPGSGTRRGPGPTGARGGAPRALRAGGGAPGGPPPRAPPRPAPPGPQHPRRRGAAARGAGRARADQPAGGKGGMVRIAFGTEAELHRLFEALLRAGRGRG